jgi:hypothetical protein
MAVARHIDEPRYFDSVIQAATRAGAALLVRGDGVRVMLTDGLVGLAAFAAGGLLAATAAFCLYSPQLLCSWTYKKSGRHADGLPPITESVSASAAARQARRAIRAVTHGFGELDVLVPAYSATIHKSQGSEYPAVIIPVLTQHYPMLQRNLLYTGVTRGTRLVVLVGQKKAVAIAARNAASRRRWSKLAEWLRLGASRGSSALRIGE